MFITVITFITLITPAPALAQPQPFPTPTEATPAAVVSAKEDLTQPTAETKGRLERLVETQELGPVSIQNSLRYAIRASVSHGVPANTLVLLLLFPLIVMLIAAARHLFGLRGFGIFTPAVIAVAFLATGLTLGLGLFLGTLVIAALARWITKRLRLQYLPRLALLILFICIGILGAFLSVSQGPTFGHQRLDLLWLATNVGIFPLLLLILLTETFISAEISHGAKFAVRITVETLFLAVISYLIMDLKTMQSWVLLHPEATIISLAAANILLGKFTGLRLFEYWRFRELLRK